MESKDKHVGEAGKHKGHPLELLPNGRVYCNTCQHQLSANSADKAWPIEDQSAAANK